MLCNRQLRVNLLALVGTVMNYLRLYYSFFNYMISSGTYMRTREQAFIKETLKKGKDPLLPGSKHSVSLIN